MTEEPRGETGVVLLNVLVILALCAGLLVTMLRLSGTGIARSGLFADAGQALSIALAGEASAAAALRRDLAEAPLSDHAKEAWASVAQDSVSIAGGRFALHIADAQARMNLTDMTGFGGKQRLQALATALGLRPEVPRRLAVRLAQPEPPTDLADLARDSGVAPEDIAVLEPYVVILPDPAPVNLNSCPEILLQVLFGNAATAAVLAERRSRQGFLTSEDLAEASAVLPPGTGFASRFFTLDITVRTGRAEQRIHSLLRRGFGPGGVPEVAVVMRRPGLPAGQPP